MALAQTTRGGLTLYILVCPVHVNFFMTEYLLKHAQVCKNKRIKHSFPCINVCQAGV